MTRLLPILALLLALPLWACSTYTDHTRETQRAVAQGNVDHALVAINEHILADGPNNRPADLRSEQALYLLERAMLHQALGNYDQAAEDMIAIDDHLEFTDFTSQTADNILSFTYSDSSGEYRAPPHERLLLNTMNMINFLALGQDNRARVEARRFQTMLQYYLDTDPDELFTDILGLGEYISGVAFEAGTENSRAVRHYVQAYSYGVWPEVDDRRLIDLINLTGYRGQGLGDRRELVGDLFERAAQHPRLNRDEYRQTHLRGDTLIVVQTGLVPYREAQRIGLESAVDRTYASRYRSQFYDGSTRAQLLSLSSSNTINWLNTTRLSTTNIPQNRQATLGIDNARLQLQHPIKLTEQISQEWESIATAAMAAGISRALTRTAVGEGVSAGVEALSGSSTLGSLAGLLSSTTMAIADTPDTRSWTTLPDEIHLIRLPLGEGPRELELSIDGTTDHRTVDIQPDRFQLFNFSQVR